MKKILLVIFTFGVHFLHGQSSYKVTGNEIVLSNGKISRTIKIQHDSIYSYQLTVSQEERNFISRSNEFSLTLDDHIVNGNSGWELISTQVLQDEHEGKGVTITLQGKGQAQAIRVGLHYLLYPNLPLIRKWISVTNNGASVVKLEAVNVEDLQTRLSQVSSVVYHSYGRMKQLGRFIGNWDDAVAVVHEFGERRGMALGNEAPSVLKRTTYHTRENNVEIGMTHPGQDFPFRKWIEPGDSWESPRTLWVCMPIPTTALM